MGQGSYITVVDSKGDHNEISAYHVAPMRAKPKGGIVVLQEIFGVNEYIREVCEDFAEKGWEVIAPSLFDRESKKKELNYDADGLAQGRALRDSVDSFSENDIAACCGHFLNG